MWWVSKFLVQLAHRDDDIKALETYVSQIYWDYFFRILLFFCCCPKITTKSWVLQRLSALLSISRHNHNHQHV